MKFDLIARGVGLPATLHRNIWPHLPHLQTGLPKRACIREDNRVVHGSDYRNFLWVKWCSSNLGVGYWDISCLFEADLFLV